MWYGYIPSSHISTSICSFNRDFCGYTDNKFMYQKFSEFLRERNCRNLLEEGVGTFQFQTKKECIDAINYVLLNNELLFPERYQLRCHTSSSMDNGTVAVLNEVMYDNFIACLGMNHEVRKIAADLFRLCSNHAATKCYKYLGEHVTDKRIIFQVIIKLREYYNKIGPTLQSRGEYALLDRGCTKPPLMWEVFDEASYINQYLDKVYRIGFDLSDPIIQGSMNGMFC